jgi:hypothetical protein
MFPATGFGMLRGGRIRIAHQIFNSHSAGSEEYICLSFFSEKQKKQICLAKTAIEVHM